MFGVLIVDASRGKREQRLAREIEARQACSATTHGRVRECSASRRHYYVQPHFSLSFEQNTSRLPLSFFTKSSIPCTSVLFSVASCAAGAGH